MNKYICGIMQYLIKDNKIIYIIIYVFVYKISSYYSNDVLNNFKWILLIIIVNISIIIIYICILKN